MALYGQDDDEDEKFKQMLGGILGNGPSPIEADSGPLAQMSQPQPQGLGGDPDSLQLGHPYMPQSAGVSGLGGYTPPPPPADPQYLDHVQGHQFGAGDLAMLGGILAAAIGGGRFRGAAMGSMAGSYGNAIMQANDRADARNAKIDEYNNTLANKSNDPLERWKADQVAQYQAGNLKTRGEELALQKSREQRIEENQLAESMKDPAEEARRIAEARAGVELDTTRKKNDMEVGTREMLGEILGKQRAEFAAPTGKGAAAGGGMNDPMKELKRRQAQAALDGMDNGTVNPLTGKPVEPPKAATKSRTPFADTEFDEGGEELFNEKNSTAGNYQKNSDTDSELSKGIAAMKKMRDLIRDNGSQWGSDENSAKLKGEFDSAKGVVQSSQAKLRALGVLQQKEQEKVDAAIGADMGPGMSDLTSKLGLGDLRVGRLEGAIKSFEDMQSISRHANGLRAKSPKSDYDGTKPSGKIEFSDEGGSFGPGDQTGKPSSGGGKQMTTVVSPDGKITKSAEMDDETRARFQAAKWTVR